MSIPCLSRPCFQDHVMFAKTISSLSGPCLMFVDMFCQQVLSKVNMLCQHVMSTGFVNRFVNMFCQQVLSTCSLSTCSVNNSIFLHFEQNFHKPLKSKNNKEEFRTAWAELAVKKASLFTFMIQKLSSLFTFAIVLLLYQSMVLSVKIQILFRGHFYIMLGHRGGWVVQKMAIFPYFM